MFSFFDFLNLLSELVHIFGLLVFGVAAGWLTLYAFRGRTWQLQIAVFLGFFFLAGAITFSTSPASVGAFGLGAGAAVLFWGLRGQEESAEKETDQE